MKIRVEFTLNIPAADLPLLRELSVSEDQKDIRDFIRMDVTQYIIDYLTSNGVNGVTVQREKVQ